LTLLRKGNPATLADGITQFLIGMNEMIRNWFFEVNQCFPFISDFQSGLLFWSEKME